MKKTSKTLLLALLTVLTFNHSTLAGDSPSGGKSCQPTPTVPCQNHLQNVESDVFESVINPKLNFIKNFLSSLFE